MSLPSTIDGEFAQYRTELETVRFQLMSRPDAASGVIGALVGEINTTLGTLNTPGLSEKINLSEMVALTTTINHLKSQAVALLRVPVINREVA